MYQKYHIDFQCFHAKVVLMEILLLLLFMKTFIYIKVVFESELQWLD